jgi:hypothetical protein
MDEAIDYLAPLKMFAAILLLSGYFTLKKRPEKQPNKRSTAVFISDDLEIGRHRHDGSQPTTDRVRPGQSASVAWNTGL